MAAPNGSPLAKVQIDLEVRVAQREAGRGSGRSPVVIRRLQEISQSLAAGQPAASLRQDA